MHHNWVSIAKYSSTQTASIAVAILNENEIEAVELNKKDSATSLFGYIEIMVPQQYVNDAKVLLQPLNEL
jgi:Putative prokaryotic signal transducing protein